MGNADYSGGLPKNYHESAGCEGVRAAAAGGNRLRSDRSNLIAEVYDLDKPIDAHYRDVEYYTCVLRGLGGRILEVACGTGRFLIPLLEAGLDVEGLDHSPEMLDVCRRLCRERGLDPVLHVGDMSSFELPGPYDVVMLGSGVIKEMEGREAALQALTCCRDSLVPGGRVFVDLVPPRHVSGAMSPDRPTEPGPARVWRRDSSVWTLETIQLEYDSAANRTIEWLRYEKWRDAELVASELRRFCVQHWTLWEFEQLLDEAGFTDVVVVADYRDEPPGPRNDDWTFIATRP